jgi:hypothetical protein
MLENFLRARAAIQRQKTFALSLPWRRVFLIGFGRLKNLWNSRPDE